MYRTVADWLAGGETIAAVGAVLTVLGSVLPWIATRPAATLGGTPGGPVTALLGVGVVLIALFRPWALIDRIVVALLGMATLLVAANAVMTLRTVAEATPVGIGLYVVLGGGLVVVVGAAVGLVSGDTDRPNPTARGW